MPRSPLVLQITDSHLFAEADGRLLGMVTRDSLDQVVKLARAELEPVDLLLATGDLSQDGSLESYQAFAERAAQFDAPVRWIPGNHDEPMVMEQAAVGQDWLEPVTDIGAWRVIMLDSAIVGSVPGRLAPAALDILDKALASAAGRFPLVCLHHHPVPIGCTWMNPIGLQNDADLLERLAQHPGPKTVLWGHVHQQFDEQRGDLRLIASPSTCIQFEPGSEDFAVGRQLPGYRWLRLHDDGTLDTGVSRLVDYPFEVDFGSTGY